MNYTKGEWVTRYSGVKEQPYYIETNEKTIANLWGFRFQDEAKVNAQLIASAPEMYEALKLILSLGFNDGRRWIAQQALAKAEGKAD